MQDITTVGVDLAKEVFAVCVLDMRRAPWIGEPALLVRSST